MTRSFTIRRAMRWSLVFGCGAVLGITVGCGGTDGPSRAEVSGTVTYDGQPVPKGFVTFSPDTSKGASGPGSGAPIEAGQYVTPDGKGAVGGPHRVRIIGYDGVPTSLEGEELPDGKPLFPPYESTVDLPAEASTQDFQIPAAMQ